MSACLTKSFQVSQGPKGGTILSLMVGETGAINFLLLPDLEKQLFDALGKAARSCESISWPSSKMLGSVTELCAKKPDCHRVH